MNISPVAYVGFGMLIGIGIVFYDVDKPRSDTCSTYKVRNKSVTAYVLKPPPPIITQAVCPAQKCEPVNVVEQKTEPENIEDEKPKRRHRWSHRRVRRYWR